GANQRPLSRYCDTVIKDHESSRQDDIIPVSVAINYHHIVSRKSHRRHVEPVMNIGYGSVYRELIVRHRHLIVLHHIFERGQARRSPVAIAMHNTGIIALYGLVNVVKLQYQVGLPKGSNGRKEFVLPGPEAGV